jgi:hypothetical protein
VTCGHAYMNPKRNHSVSVHSVMFRDRNTKKLTDADKGKIIALLQSGRSVVNAAAELNLNKKTVVGALVSKKLVGFKGSDRPPATTAEEDSRIMDAVRAKPITTAQEIAG